MAYVNVPKDLTKVKTKVLFNLTKRQLIRKRRTHRRTTFLFAQGQHRYQPRRNGDDGGDDPGYAVRHV